MHAPHPAAPAYANTFMAPPIEPRSDVFGHSYGSYVSAEEEPLAACAPEPSPSIAPSFYTPTSSAPSFHAPSSFSYPEAATSPASFQERSDSQAENEQPRVRWIPYRWVEYNRDRASTFQCCASMRAYSPSLFDVALSPSSPARAVSFSGLVLACHMIRWGSLWATLHPATNLMLLPHVTTLAALDFNILAVGLSLQHHPPISFLL